jgi:hypothetical protein
MNKLDAFNNDKTKCKKCKNYYDKIKAFGAKKVLCDSCYEKWFIACQQRLKLTGRHMTQRDFENWCNEK